ncbi:hypothetical protein [Ligilactobacillus sp. LYQ60]|uniref:hypothetical protein n=1 Tax=Ligilactobacillus sp. LYQ60 TaxID=3378799 RepID=UPI003852D243
MKKKINWNTITVTVLVVLGLVLGIKITRGIIVQHEEKIKQHEELASLVKEEEPKIKQCIHEQDKSSVIKTVTIEYGKTYMTPMHFVEIKGYVNNNKKLKIGVEASVTFKNGKPYLADFDLSESADLDKLTNW